MVRRSPNPIVSTKCFSLVFSQVQDEPAFFHAAVALASTQQAVLPVISANLQVSVDDHKLQTALQHYGKALRSSYQYIAKFREHADALGRVILISFLLFLFNLSQGDEVGAKIHRRLSIAIARSHRHAIQGRTNLDGSLSIALSLLRIDDPVGHLSTLINLPTPRYAESESETESSSVHFYVGQQESALFFRIDRRGRTVP